MNKNNILFVCTSNQDRSPALEKHFKNLFPQHEYRSAGINRYHTTKKGNHVITQEDVYWADIIVCAETVHRKFITDNFQISERTEYVLNMGDYKHGQMDQYVKDAEKRLNGAFCNELEIFSLYMHADNYCISEMHGNTPTKLTPEFLETHSNQLSDFQLILRDYDQLTEEECRFVLAQYYDQEFFSSSFEFTDFNITTLRNFVKSILSKTESHEHTSKYAFNSWIQIIFYLLKQGVSVPIPQLNMLTPIECFVARKNNN